MFTNGLCSTEEDSSGMILVLYHLTHLHHIHLPMYNQVNIRGQLTCSSPWEAGQLVWAFPLSLTTKVKWKFVFGNKLRPYNTHCCKNSVNNNNV